MSQILLKQRLLSHTKNQFQYPMTNSSAQKLVCYVCSKGLEEGHRVTAKSMNSEIRLFCDIHYSLV